MRSISRRAALERGGVALAAGLGGCLGESDSTDSPTPSETARTECQGASTDVSWKTGGSWDVDILVTNDDAVAYTVTATVVHAGSEPCHHVESTPCQMPEQSKTAFDRTFGLEADESRTFRDVTLELWEDWIDDYTVEVRVENDGSPSSDRVFAYETGAKEAVGTDEYDRADFYICDGADRTIESTVSNGTPHTTF